MRQARSLLWGVLLSCLTLVHASEAQRPQGSGTFCPGLTPRNNSGCSSLPVPGWREPQPITLPDWIEWPTPFSFGGREKTWDWGAGQGGFAWRSIDRFIDSRYSALARRLDAELLYRSDKLRQDVGRAIGFHLGVASFALGPTPLGGAGLVNGAFNLWVSRPSNIHSGSSILGHGLSLGGVVESGFDPLTVTLTLGQKAFEIASDRRVEDRYSQAIGAYDSIRAFDGSTLLEAQGRILGVSVFEPDRMTGLGLAGTRSTLEVISSRWSLRLRQVGGLHLSQDGEDVGRAFSIEFPSTTLPHFSLGTKSVDDGDPYGGLDVGGVTIGMEPELVASEESLGAEILDQRPSAESGFWTVTVPLPTSAEETKDKDMREKP